MTAERPSYREVKPSAALVPYVQCYWFITAVYAPPVLNRICPDGCADIIVDLSATLPIGGAPGVGRCYAVGTMLRAARIALAGAIHLVGVRLRPGTAGPIFGLPMHELTDTTAPLPDLWAEATDLGPSLAEATTPSDRVARLERSLLARLRRVREPAAVVRQAIRFVARTGGTRPVRELEQAVGLGGRHLERHFRDAVGISPKSFARVVRFRRALAAMQQSGTIPWSRLAAETGYYDQAHLIREVRALAGVTPTGLATELRQVGSVQYETNIPE